MVDIDAGDVEKPDDLPSFPFVDMLRQDVEQELRRHGNLSQTCTAHQRDSGCVRDSVVSVGEGENTGSVVCFHNYVLVPVFSVYDIPN
jgi:hypothetical protein